MRTRPWSNARTPWVFSFLCLCLTAGKQNAPSGWTGALHGEAEPAPGRRARREGEPVPSRQREEEKSRRLARIALGAKTMDGIYSVGAASFFFRVFARET